MVIHSGDERTLGMLQCVQNGSSNGRASVTWLLNLQSSDARTAGLFVDATFQLADVEASQWPSASKHLHPD